MNAVCLEQCCFFNSEHNERQHHQKLLKDALSHMLIKKPKINRAQHSKMIKDETKQWREGNGSCLFHSFSKFHQYKYWQRRGEEKYSTPKKKKSKFSVPQTLLTDLVGWLNNPNPYSLQTHFPFPSSYSDDLLDKGLWFVFVVLLV